jgi:lysophospholipase L1-like esterase
MLNCAIHLCLAADPVRAEEGAMLAGASRVVFLGDSITHAGRFLELIDAYYTTRFPSRFEFLNLGLPSETVSGLSEPGHADGQFARPDLHERLARVLDWTMPDVVIACYGMNDGIYLPYSDERFQKFREGLLWLRERVSAAGAKLICVTPPTFDEVKGGHPGYAETLQRYADWMLEQRTAGWNVADLHGPMTRFLAQRRTQNPDFFLAGDGVHPNETGHWIMARQILLHLGAKDLDGVENVKSMLAVHPNGEALLRRVEQRQRILRDAWLTHTGHQRPGMSKGLPVPEAEAKAAEIGAQICQLQ